VDQDRIAVFVMAGTVIPTFHFSPGFRSSQDPSKKLGFKAFLDSNSQATGKLYTSDYTSLFYKDNKFEFETLNFKEGKLTCETVKGEKGFRHAGCGEIGEPEIIC